MTFDDFKQLCDEAVTTASTVSSPCPIDIGTPSDPVLSQLGDKPDHALIVYRTKPDDETLRSIYRSVSFTFDAPNNQTVINPLTTGT